MKRFLHTTSLILLLGIFFNITNATAQTWTYTKVYPDLPPLVSSFSGSVFNTINNNFAKDQNGNFYLSSNFLAPAQVDGITLNTGNTLVAKFDSLGHVIWASSINIPSFGVFIFDVDDMGVDTMGNVYIQGSFYVPSSNPTATNIGNGVILNYNTVGGIGQTYIAKFNSSGVIQWAKPLSVSQNTSFFARSLVITDGGEIITSGVYQGSVIYDNTTQLTAGNTDKSFLLKLDTNGNAIWAKNTLSGNSNIVVVEDIKKSVDDNFIYPVGFTTNGVNSSLFVSKYDIQTGTQQSSLLSQSLPNDFGTIRAAVSDSGDIFIAAEFDDRVSFNNNQLLTSSFASDFLLVKADKNGTWDFVRQLSSLSFNRINDIIWKEEGIIIGGRFSNELFLDTTDLILSFENTPTSLLQFNQDGQFEYFKTIPSVGDVGLERSIISLIPNDDDRFYTFGTVNSNGIFEEDTVYTSNGIDLFLGELSCIPKAISRIVGDTVVCAGQQVYSLPITNFGDGIDYQWTVNGNATFTQGDTFITVIFPDTGVYTITVSAVNACGTSPPVSLQVNVIGVPDVQIINGDPTACLGQTTYNVEDDPFNTYTWTFSGGGAIFPIGNTAIVNWAVTGNYNVNVIASNICGTGPLSTFPVTVKAIPAEPSPIVGNNNVCVSTQTYSVNLVSDVNYIWSLSSGGTIASNGNVATVNWSTAGTHTILVTPTNECGTGSSKTLTVNVNDVPSQPSTVVGNLTTCIGTESYSIVGNTNVNYNWSISGGGILTSGGSSASVIWTSSGTHTLTITPSNICGTGTPRTVNVVVQDVPNQVGNFIGLDTVCIGQQNYQVPLTQGVNYTWTISGGGTVFPTGNAATVDWTTPGTHTLTVTPYNNCGTGLSRTYAIFVKNINSAFSTITGEDTVCLGLENYSVPNIGGITYEWSINGGGSLTELNNTAFVNWSGTGVYTLNVATSDGCNSALNVEVRDAPSQPSTIFGDTLVCVGTYNYGVLSENNVNYSWSVSGGGILIENANLATINWTTPGIYTLTVTPFNDCGTGTARTITVNVQTIPNAPNTITGDTLVCAASNEIYVVPSNSNVTYNWSLSNDGAVLTPTANQAVINWQTIDTNTITVTASNLCGTSSQTTLAVEIIDAPISPIIIGDTTTCIETETYSVLFENYTSYAWNLSSGGSLTASGNTADVNWTNTGTHTLSTVATNLCGTATNSISINTIDVPTQPVAIIGDGLVCQGLKSYSVTNVANTNYTWTISGGGAISALDNVANINWTTPGTYTISVIPFNECGTGTPLTKTITVLGIPAQPSNISGVNTTCLTTDTYSVTNDSSVNYIWTLNGGGVLSQNGNTATINWQSTGTYTINVIPQNTCGVGNPRTLTVQVSDIPNEPQLSIGDTSVCLGNETYVVSPVLGTTYNWSLSSGGILTATTNSASINWSTTGMHTIMVTPSNACGTGNPLIFTVNVKDIPSPIASISGANDVCLGNQTYSVPNVIGENYNWTISGGGTITASGNTANINWANAGTHTITVTPSNTCGTGTTVTKTVLVRDIPPQPSVISGLTTTCLTTDTYSVVNDTATTYSWSLSGGGTLSQNGNTATITWQTPGLYTLSVVPQNSCGAGIARTMTIQVGDVPNQPQLSTGNTNVCLGSELYAISTISSVNYSWSLSSGGTISAAGSSGTINWTNTGTHTITVTPSNSCGNGTALTFSVDVNTTPNQIATISGNNNVCLGSETYTVPNILGQNYTWTLSSGGLLSANGNTATITWLSKGSHTLSVVPSNGCGAAPVTSLVVNVGDVPDQPFPISGENSVCINTTETYSTAAINNTSYTWTLSSGGNLTSNNNLVTIDWTSEGLHTITVVPSNNCGNGVSQVLTVEVRANDLSSETITGDTLVCNGTEVFYTADFNPDLDYDWFISGNGNLTQVSNSAVVQWQTAGNATIGLIPSSDCGAGDTSFINVTIQDPLEIPTITQSGDSLLTNVSEGLTWYLENEAIPITTDFLIPQIEGIYTVTAENICGETGFSQPFLIGGRTSGFYLYPNPAKNRVTLRFPIYLRWYYYRVYDYTGRLVMERQEYNGTQEDEIDIRQFQSGIYIVEVYTELGFFSKKLVVSN